MFDHVTIRASDRAASRTFYELALSALGHGDEQPEYHPGYYAAYVLDPDGNNVEVVHHKREGPA